MLRDPLDTDPDALQDNVIESNLVVAVASDANQLVESKAPSPERSSEVVNQTIMVPVVVAPVPARSPDLPVEPARDVVITPVPTESTPSLDIPAVPVRVAEIPPAPAPAPAPMPVPKPTPEVRAGAVHTGFDAGEHVKASDSVQNALPLLGVPERWAAVRTVDDDPGKLTITYEGGDAAERSASVIAEPGRPGNGVLKFALNSANVRDNAGVPYKGRVQMNAIELQAREISYSVRMYLHPDMAHLRTMPEAFKWLTISEWWNNAGWTGERFPFRISVNLAKPSAKVGTPLNFRVSAETLNVATGRWHNPVWTSLNSDVQVPIGRWVTLEYYFREGNASEGRFYMAMVPDGEARRVLFDVHGWTHHPSDPAPDGLTHLNPVKLYTSRLTIDHVRSRGGSLQVYWDDLSFRICSELTALESSLCSPVASH